MHHGTTTQPAHPSRRRARRALSTLAVLSLSGVGLVTVGANALFTSSKATNDAGQNGGTAFTTGTVVLNLGAQGALTNSVDIAATGLVPGDTIQRVIEVVNAGNQDFAGVTLSTSATASNELTTATTGLQLKVEECSVAWAKPGAPYVYTCSGTTNALTNFNSVNVVQSAASVVTAGGQTLNTAGNTARYRITMTLPSNYTGSSSSATSTTINYTFTATQRSGTNK